MNFDGCGRRNSLYKPQCYGPSAIKSIASWTIIATDIALGLRLEPWSKLQ